MQHSHRVDDQTKYLPAGDAPTHLLCDLRQDPLGLPGPIPTFTWRLPGGALKQDAYQIQVATSIPKLEGETDLHWDSGKVQSERSLHTPYSGPPLHPGSVYFWRVRIWDERGQASPFSQPSSFVTGLWEGFAAQWIWSGDAPQQNQHVLFRKQVQLPQRPIRRALAFVTADDYYKLYIDGRFVGQGPAPGYPLIQYHYNTIDITSYVTSKEPLCLAAHAYYQGLKNYVWVSGDGRRGFILELYVEFEDGRAWRIGTDESWRSLTIGAYQGRHTFGPQTGFNEDIDARELPVAWQAPHFDDAGWPHATWIAKPDWKLHAQETEMLSVYEVKPIHVVEKGPNHYFFDFGREVVGTVRISFSGTEGDVVRLRLGEEMSAPRSVRHELRANCLYEDDWTLRDGEQQLELYDYRAFRYGEVLSNGAQIDPDSITAIVRHYPADATQSEFRCSDERLNALWELTKYSIVMGSQEVYLDCPTREKANYSLDAFLQMSAAFYQTGEANLGRRMIELLLQSDTTGKLRCLAPAARDHFFTEYTLYPILMAWRYYWFTGDDAFLERNYKALDQVVRYFEGTFARDDGLLEGTDEVLHDLVDWPPNRRDGHEMLPVNIVPNSVYFRALTIMEQIAGLVGAEDDRRHFRGLAVRVREALNSLLWDETSRRYVDGLGADGRASLHSSLHSNAFPLAMGVVPHDRVPDVLAFIRTRGLACNTFLAMFLFEALYDYGAADHAFALLTADGDNSPMHMVREGATTTWEAWALEQKWNTSLFHPATAFTGYILASRTLGVMPLAPGFKRIAVKPQLVDVVEAFIQVPTLYGPVHVECSQKVGEGFAMRVSVPPNTTAVAYVPLWGATEAVVRVNGAPANVRIEGEWMVLDDLPPGTHTIERR